MKKIVFILGISFSANSFTNAQTNVIRGGILPVSISSPNTVFQGVTTSLNYLNIEKSFKAFPNPALNELNIIEANFYDFNGAEVVISDTKGQFVLKQNNLLFVENTATINIENLPSGLYSLILTSANKKITLGKKFIINR